MDPDFPLMPHDLDMPPHQEGGGIVFPMDENSENSQTIPSIKGKRQKRREKKADELEKEMEDLKLEEGGTEEEKVQRQKEVSLPTFIKAHHCSL